MFGKKHSQRLFDCRHEFHENASGGSARQVIRERQRSDQKHPTEKDKEADHGGWIAEGKGAGMAGHAGPTLGG